MAPLQCNLHYFENAGSKGSAYVETSACRDRRESLYVSVRRRKSSSLNQQCAAIMLINIKVVVNV